MPEGKPKQSDSSDPRALEKQLLQLETELQAHRDQQAALMRLLGTSNPTRIEHDVRNVMNELALYKSLVGSDEK